MTLAVFVVLNLAILAAFGWGLVKNWRAYQNGRRSRLLHDYLSGVLFCGLSVLIWQSGWIIAQLPIGTLVEGGAATAAGAFPFTIAAVLHPVSLALGPGGTAGIFVCTWLRARKKRKDGWDNRVNFLEDPAFLVVSIFCTLGWVYALCQPFSPSKFFD